jgi:hypothetical protein
MPHSGHSRGKWHAVFASFGPSGTPDVKNVQDGALRNAVSGTLRDCFCEQSFELPQVCDLGADVIEMVRSDLAHICARRFSRSPQGEQRADVFETETKLAAASDEGKNTSIG